MTDGPGNEPFFEHLSSEECMRLLVEHSVGRFAVATPDSSPLVVPVNYVMDHGVVVFRSDIGEKLDGVGGHLVSFEVDEIDPYHHTGWSVLVKGAAYEATHWEVEHLVLQPWAPGEKGHWVRLVPTFVSGRRIRLAPFVPDKRAYL